MVLDEVGDNGDIDGTMGLLEAFDGIFETVVAETTVSSAEFNDMLDTNGVDMTVSLDVKDIFETVGIDTSGVDMTDRVREASRGTEDASARYGGDATDSLVEAIVALDASVDKGVAERVSTTKVEDVVDRSEVEEATCDCCGEKTESIGE